MHPRQIGTKMLGHDIVADVDGPGPEAPKFVAVAPVWTPKELEILIGKPDVLRAALADIINPVYGPGHRKWNSGTLSVIGDRFRRADGKEFIVVPGDYAVALRYKLPRGTRAFWQLYDGNWEGDNGPGFHNSPDRAVKNGVAVEYLPEGWREELERVRAEAEAAVRRKEEEAKKREGLYTRVPVAGDWTLVDAGFSNGYCKWAVMSPEGVIETFASLRADHKKQTLVKLAEAISSLFPAMAEWALRSSPDPEVSKAAKDSLKVQKQVLRAYGQCEELREVIRYHRYNFDGIVNEISRRRSWGTIMGYAEVPKNVLARRVAEVSVGKPRDKVRELARTALNPNTEAACREVITSVGFEWLARSYGDKPADVPLSKKEPLDLMLDEYLPPEEEANPVAAAVPPDADPVMRAEFLKFMKRRDQLAKRKAAKIGHHGKQA